MTGGKLGSRSYAKENIERLHMEKVNPKVMEGTAKNVPSGYYTRCPVTPREQGRIRKQISRLTFQEIDCMDFVRHRVDFD
jgi:site-specific DNA-cytosine methylase